MTDRVTDWFARAQACIPGGVNSPVRAFGAVGGDPFFVARATGSHIVDTDGRDYLDYVQSWGASILGHAHPAIVDAVQRAAAAGTSYGAPTEREVELAEAIAATVAKRTPVQIVLIVLGIVVLREQLNRVQWIAVAIATAGVAYLTFETGHVPWAAFSVAASFGFYGLIRKVAKVDALPGLARP